VNAAGRPCHAVLELEPVVDQTKPVTRLPQEVRLRNATAQLRRGPARRRRYRPVDPAPSLDLPRQLRAQQKLRYRGDDCAEQVGPRLGVDLVMATGVQKAGERILNPNCGR
jgi:Protein of unknown function (DUF2380)